MNLSNLKPAGGSTRVNKRLGRGTGSGWGGTASRGHKGAKSRSGYSQKVGFEGGQMPLHRRIPKFGFKNPNRVEFKSVNLDTLFELADKLKTTDLSIEVLVNNGIVSNGDLVKILGRNLKSATGKLTVSAHAFSESAKSLIESNGGQATLIEKK